MKTPNGKRLWQPELALAPREGLWTCPPTPSPMTAVLGSVATRPTSRTPCNRKGRGNPKRGPWMDRTVVLEVTRNKMVARPDRAADRRRKRDCV
ncbi:hypothetical protein VTO73DRAFT_7283 [Trametes versicolor]